MSSSRVLFAALVAASTTACPKADHAARPAAAPLATSAHGIGAPGDPSADNPGAAVATSAGSSPVEKWLAGDRTFGVYSIHDAAHCDIASWNATAPKLGLADQQVLPPSTVLVGTTVTVQAMTGGIIDDLTKVMTALRDAGGSDIDGHHICVVPAAGVGVALSTGSGFIAFEPAAILQMNELIPDSDRTMYSSWVAFAHEFAHQLQYWYGDPFDGDKSVRHTELAADCMGTAFVAMTQPAGWITDQVEQGAVGALQAYADLKFRSKSHHGTRYDRARMARDGVALVTTARKAGTTLDISTIKDGCEQAVRAWDASMPLTPPDQLWGGTED